MNKSNKITLLCLLLLATAMAHSVAAFREQIKSRGEPHRKVAPSKDGMGADFNAQFPVVDIESPEPPDGDEREKRKSKGRRYDNYGMVVKDQTTEIDQTIWDYPWQQDVKGLPVAQSAVVLLGEVDRVTGHLSNDKSGVYSELIIRVDEVLKVDAANNIMAGEKLTADRPGGLVKYPNGHKRLYRIFGMNIPRPARRYLLFLATTEDSPNYRIITGYELAPAGVVPLDIAPHFDTYKGLDEMTFLKTVRDAISQP